MFYQWNICFQLSQLDLELKNEVMGIAISGYDRVPCMSTIQACHLTGLGIRIATSRVSESGTRFGVYQ